jgi:hypothetical protein
MPNRNPLVSRSIHSLRVALSLAALALAGCGEPLEQELLDTTTSRLVADGDYVIKSVHSGKCLDIAAASTADGARVQQWDCNGTGAQRFRVVAVGGGFQRITNILSDKSFDVASLSTADGAPIQQWGYAGTTHQQFMIRDAGGGSQWIQARHSGKALDVAGWGTTAGTAIIQWPYLGGANQRFLFERVGATPAPAPTVAGTAPRAGARVTVSGRRILVNGLPLELRGVCWNPVAKGKVQPAEYSVFAPQDLPLMKAAGINAVRTYEVITHRAVLDQLLAAGIWLLPTVYAYGADAEARAVERVNAIKDHPVVLMWLLGNEWNYNGLYTGVAFNTARDRLQRIGAAIHAADPTRPVATVYGEMPTAATLAAMPAIDVWGLNVYRGISFGDLFTRWSALSGKPMFLAEFGADAWDSRSGGRENVQAQADATRALLGELRAANATAFGGTLFEWSDEWWKDGSGSPAVHDVGGVAPGGGPHPDATFNEEWWGIVDVDRRLRPAYQVVRELWLR